MDACHQGGLQKMMTHDAFQITQVLRWRNSVGELLLGARWTLG